MSELDLLKAMRSRALEEVVEAKKKIADELTVAGREVALADRFTCRGNCANDSRKPVSARSARDEACGEDFWIFGRLFVSCGVAGSGTRE